MNATPNEVAAQAIERDFNRSGRTANLPTPGRLAARPGALAALLHELHGLGVEAPARVGELLERAGTVRNSPGEASKAARDERAAMPARVANGELSLDEAARRLAELGPWLLARPDAKSTAVGELAEQAAAELEKRAVSAAAEGAEVVIDELADLAHSEVEAAVAAVDRLPVTRGVTAARLFAAAKANSGRAPQHPVFALSVSTIGADLLPAWAAAQEATNRFRQLRELAGKVVAITGRGKTGPLFASPGTQSERGMLGLLPDALQLGIAARSGWQPGLHPRGTVARPARDDGGVIKRVMHQFKSAVTGRS